MRFIKPTLSPGDTKQKRFFALFPRTIGKETRWLERVTIEYRYETYSYVMGDYGRCYSQHWVKYRFVNP